jgi:hypothetical protein
VRALLSSPFGHGPPEPGPDPAQARLAPAIALLVVYTLCRGLLLVGLIVPWQGPDEPGHAQVAWQLGHGAGTAAPDPAFERAALASMAEQRFFSRVGIPVPTAPPASFAAVERLGGDPTQLQNETPVGYLPHALTLRLGAAGAVEGDLRRMRLASLLLVPFVLLGAARAARGALALRGVLAVTALVAAAPMLGFAGAVVNNDLPAAALAAWWFALLADGLRQGLTLRRLALLGGVMLLAVLAKRTALYLLPLTLLVVAWAAWQELAAGRSLRPAGGRRARAGLAGVALAALLVIVLGRPIADQAAAWHRAGTSWGPERAPAGRSGGFAFRIVDDQAAGWQYLEQSVAAPGPAEVMATAWLRTARPGTRAQLVLSDDRGTWLGQTVELADAWTPVHVSGRSAAGASRLRLAIVPGDGVAAGVGDLLADDVSLRVDGRERLVNGGAEGPRRLGAQLAAGALRYADAARLAATLPGGLADPPRTLARSAGGLAFLARSFWGGFGWATIWPGRPYGLTAGLLTLVVLAGVLQSLVRPASLVTDPGAARLLRWCAVAVLLAVAVATFGSLAGAGPDRLPQGRYLVAALVPLALPAVALAARLAPRWGPFGLAAWALGLDLIALFAVIWPAFRGPV